METIIEFVKTNWLLVIGVVALIIYAIWDYVKKNKAKKKREEMRKRFEAEQYEAREFLKQQRPPEQENEFDYTPRYEELRRKEEPNLSSYFTDKKETSKEVSMDLKDFTVQVMNEKSEVEKHIKTQIDELKKELSETTKKKEEIRKQGIALATLFDKYKEREEQLRRIIEK
jgi:hypothetical protein